MKISLLYFLIGSVFFLWSCRDVDDFKDNPVPYSGTKILAHKGGGSPPYTSYPDNTMEAVIFGFSNTDGIEIDVQKSRANTLWLFHNGFLPPCNGNDKERISRKFDSEIEEYIQCIGGGFKIDQLEEVFAYHRAQKLNKKISLDVKSWLPSLHSNSPKYHTDLAYRLLFMVYQYGMKEYIMVECENTYFLNILKDKGDLECYLTTFGDFEEGARKALKFDYAGISYEYHVNDPLSREDIQKIRKKGLRIQLWTVNSKEDILKAMDLQPDYIQTDNVLLQ
jgi:glycerophosphoryl diester phosphodiesterase